MLHMKFEAHSMKIKGVLVVLQDKGPLGHKKKYNQNPVLSEKMPGDLQLFLVETKSTHILPPKY